jgi:hypothetical protein
MMSDPLAGAILALVLISILELLLVLEQQPTSVEWVPLMRTKG